MSPPSRPTSSRRTAWPLTGGRSPCRTRTTGRWGLCAGRLSGGRRGSTRCSTQEVSGYLDLDPFASGLLRRSPLHVAVLRPEIFRRVMSAILIRLRHSGPRRRSHSVLQVRLGTTTSGKPWETKGGGTTTSSHTLSSQRRPTRCRVPSTEARKVCLILNLLVLAFVLSWGLACSGVWENQQFPVSQYKAVP